MCFKKKIWSSVVRKYEFTCKNMWISGDIVTLKIQGMVMIHVYQNIFGKYSYEIEDKIYVPYLSKPHYDGDFGTNRQLSSYSQMLRGEMDYDIEITRNRFDQLFRELYKWKRVKKNIVDIDGKTEPIEKIFVETLNKIEFK